MLPFLKAFVVVASNHRGHTCMHVCINYYNCSDLGFLTLLCGHRPPTRHINCPDDKTILLRGEEVASNVVYITK